MDEMKDRTKGKDRQDEVYMSGIDGTIYKTTNPDCPACNAKKRHTVKEYREYHPEAGTGVDNRNKGSGG